MTRTISDASQAPPDRQRRWLQFRLRTLLLIPLLLGLFLAFSDQTFDHFIYLMLALGATFGSLWAIGRMRIVGGRSGVHRVASLASAAVQGGLTSGLVAGGAALWISVWRSQPNWMYIPTKPTWDQRVAEIGSLLVWGSALGGLLAAAGGALAGIAAAYVTQVGMQNRSAAGTELDPPTGQAAGPLSKRGQWAVLSLYFLLLSGATFWLTYRIASHHGEEQAIEALHSSGSVSSWHSYYDGPQWIRPITVGYGEIKWFHRVSILHVTPEANPESWRQIARLKYLHQMSVRIDGGDQELREVVKGLRGYQVEYVQLDLRESRITDDGLAHLREANGLRFLDISQTQVTDAGLEHLAALPKLQTVQMDGSRITPLGISRLRQRAPAVTVVYAPALVVYPP